MATKPGTGKADFPGAGGAIDAKTREAFNGAIDAMAEWREEMAGSTERYSKKVFDKLGVAARAMGWPDELIEATREQLEHASKLQMHMLDQVMDAWQQQMKAPGSASLAERVMGSMPPFQSMGGGMPSFPGVEAFQQAMSNMPGMQGMGGLPFAPMQFWMQAAEMWQKHWASAMSMWMSNLSAMPGMDPKGPRWK